VSIAKARRPGHFRMLLGQVRRTLSSISFSAKRRAYSDRPGDVSHSAIVDTILALGGIPAPFPSRLLPCHSLIRCERFSSASRSRSPVMSTDWSGFGNAIQALRNRTELGVDLAEKKKPTTGRSQVAEIAEHDRHPCIWPPAARTPLRCLPARAGARESCADFRAGVWDLSQNRSSLEPSLVDLPYKLLKSQSGTRKDCGAPG